MADIIVTNPATEEMCGHYSTMNQNQVESIIQQTHQTQCSWSKTSFSVRKKCLLELASVLQRTKKECAILITTEMGKPITESLAEVEKCAKLCEYYAEFGEQFLEPEFIQTEFQKSYRSYHPFGTIFAIMPWNFPLWQVMRFAVPNITAGNAGILKHAPNSLGAALLIEKLFVEAKFPENLFRSLIIDVDLAPFVIHHENIMGVTLTGSNNAGKAVAKEAGLALKKVILELGGSDPYVILEDADLERAAEQCIQSRLSNAGQVCIAAKRIIVVQKVRKEFEDLILEKTKKYIMGDPRNPQTNLGPMARADLRTKLHEQVERSIATGARCVLGGTIPTQKGYYYPATLLLNVTEDSTAFHEEMFGPVVCITEARDEDHAAQLANNIPYGLAGAVFTQDIERGERFAREKLDAGCCAVNVLVASDPRLPFGGTKQSGFGRELSREGMREFVNTKTVIVF